MQCDVCNELPAAALISNTGNGDTQAVCGPCLPGWCLAVLVGDAAASGRTPEDVVTQILDVVTAAMTAPGSPGPEPAGQDDTDASPTGVGTTGDTTDPATVPTTGDEASASPDPVTAAAEAGQLPAE